MPPSNLILLPPDAPLAGAPWTPELAARLQAAAWVCACLLIGGFFATLRVALLHSVSARVLARTSSARRRARIEPLLSRTESLATSAGVFEVTGEVLFAMLLLRFIADGAPIGWMSIVVTSLIAVPTLMILSEALPTAIALRRGDTLILAVLPVFNVVQMPLRWLVNALEAIRRALMRVAGLRENPSASRQIVEGLREVIADAELSGGLDETEREIISNVMEFRDVNVSAVMTPRTKIRGVEIGDGLLAAAQAAAESGHSRIPVYEGSLDTVVGVVTARDVVEVAAERSLEGASLRPILRPAHFVPETKRVSELLNEFRREKIKLAIVLDEYGGTAGLVTLGDIITEIVGHMQDEFDVDVREPVRRLPGGGAEVDAGLHVSEVNEELQLQIPEGEDFETLAGFVLSELGHFPQRGERFVLGATEYTVLEASDRRVLKVGIRPLPQEVAG